MKTRPTLALAFLGLAALVGGGAHWIARRDAELARRQQQLGALEAEARTLRQEREHTRREVAEAQQQLAALPEPPAESSAAVARRAEMRAWLARVKTLRALFEQRPHARIPEMRWLTDEDWLRVAKRCDLDSDEGRRKALADVRGAAISHFAREAARALRAFAKNATADTPADTAALSAYFNPPVEPALLERYHLQRQKDHAGREEWRIQNRAPIDPDYDWCYRLTAAASGASSMQSGQGPWAWIPDFQERLERASLEHRRRTGGTQPGKLADIIPLIQPPLDPALAAKVIAEAEKSRR